MRRDSIDTSRRRAVFVGGALLAGVASGLATLPVGAKAKKSDLQYQDTPRDGNKCAGCKHFSPGSSGAGEGTCAMVEGTVSAQGWCQAFAAK